MLTLITIVWILWALCRPRHGYWYHRPPMGGFGGAFGGGGRTMGGGAGRGRH